ncbi:hypothetical protein C481_19780 [Natrialba asiatica DSM 12278]|uniref:Uncharacterized protein n=1 Tax=Natrialba asiatica (strain ATCC 700177 / DSM 12278 / JCM 9576 / FERM P-10747 / NBRC 102637 / 172P1) TaxID=29540 RepID=M0ALF1_NATA1|nr:hypothetical protein C481_19780 [Natrialba asiatica DSM 12278]
MGSKLSETGDTNGTDGDVDSRIEIDRRKRTGARRKEREGNETGQVGTLKPRSSPRLLGRRDG